MIVLELLAVGVVLAWVGAVVFGVWLEVRQWRRRALEAKRFDQACRRLGSVTELDREWARDRGISV